MPSIAFTRINLHTLTFVMQLAYRYLVTVLEEQILADTFMKLLINKSTEDLHF
jgi:hypothetical protein